MDLGSSPNSFLITVAAFWLGQTFAFSKKDRFQVTPVPSEVRSYLGLSDFYQKRVAVGDFSVLGSKKVSDYALKEAGFLIYQMVGGKDELLTVLNQHKTRFVVMARNEFTTDIPEHSDLQPSLYWDRRARGLGATPSRPAVSCGEENLLCTAGDPYNTENILIHEFAHALHEMAIKPTFPAFQNELDECFRLAIEEKIWEGTYASTNSSEYWAECVQSWFNTNRENDNDHGNINTRKELVASDPRIARLIARHLGKNDWRYQKPDQRKATLDHLRGFDPSKEKAFEWPDYLVQWKTDFEQGKVNLAPSGSTKIKLMTPSEEKVRKSIASRKRCALYFHNLSEKTILLEWIDFEGKPRQSKILRHRDHTTINSFVGHVWEIRDSGKNKTFGRILLPKSKTAHLTFKTQ
jgi:hypothetical protein